MVRRVEEVGYQVMKKWPSYWERGLLGRDLSKDPEEPYDVTNGPVHGAILQLGAGARGSLGRSKSRGPISGGPQEKGAAGAAPFRNAVW